MKALAGARSALLVAFLALVAGLVGLAFGMGLFDGDARGAGRYALVNTVALLLVVTGLLAVLAGIFLALVEQREMKVQVITGPPTRPVPEEQQGEGLAKYGLPIPGVAEVAAGVVKGALGAVADLAGAMKSARSSVAAFVVGLALLVTACIVAGSTTPAQQLSPPTTSSTSSTTTTSP
jgi:hypothetical protein